MIYAYCRAVDRLDLALASTIWHPDGTAIYEGAFDGMGAEFVANMKKTHEERFVSHSHQVSNILIELDGDRATSESYVTAALRTKPEEEHGERLVRGRYIDTWSQPKGVGRSTIVSSCSTWQRCAQSSPHIGQRSWPGEGMTTRLTAPDFTPLIRPRVEHDSSLPRSRLARATDSKGSTSASRSVAPSGVAPSSPCHITPNGLAATRHLLQGDPIVLKGSGKASPPGPARAPLASGFIATPMLQRAVAVPDIKKREWRRNAAIQRRVHIGIGRHDIR